MKAGIRPLGVICTISHSFCHVLFLSSVVNLFMAAERRFLHLCANSGTCGTRLSPVLPVLARFSTCHHPNERAVFGRKT